MRLPAAVIGAYGFWGPKAGRDVFNIPGRTADLTFGVVTVLAGIVGTLAGGFVLDQVGATLANALLICIAACVVGYAACFAALTWVCSGIESL